MDSNYHQDYNYLPQRIYGNASLKIYEFSRELLDISRKDGKWVSGGFGSEVGKFNHPVPQKIQDAVHRGDFRINDNYPPKENEYALLAREIDEYSVLAVATQVKDNKTRYLIAYRYFWLQKPENSGMDGVGTLLSWWINTGEPKFDFEWNPDASNLNYTTQYYSRENSYQKFELYVHYVENILPKIKQYPFAFSISESDSRNGLHYLALYLNREYGTPISWAWRVGSLERPEKFTLICSDEKSHQYNFRDIQKHQKPLIPVKQQPPETQYLRQGESALNNIIDKTPQIKILLNLLDEIAKNPETHEKKKLMNDLVKCLQELTGEQLEWKQSNTNYSSSVAAQSKQKETSSNAPSNQNPKYPPTHCNETNTSPIHHRIGLFLSDNWWKIIIIVVILGSFGVGVHKIVTSIRNPSPENVDNTQKDNSDNQTENNDDLMESAINSYIKDNKNDDKEKNKRYLKNLKAPNKNMRTNPGYEWIKEKFIPKQKIDWNNNFPKTIKTILSLLDYKVGNANAGIDAQTQKAFEKFKKDNKIKDEQENKLAYDELSNQLTDKQVSVTATLLLGKIDTQTNEEFGQSIEDLKIKCQSQQPLEYINCVKNNVKPTVQTNNEPTVQKNNETPAPKLRP